MRDYRVTALATADAIAKGRGGLHIYIPKPIFIFRGCGPAIAVYVFGKRVYSKRWLA